MSGLPFHSGRDSSIDRFASSPASRGKRKRARGDRQWKHMPISASLEKGDLPPVGRALKHGISMLQVRALYAQASGSEGGCCAAFLYLLLFFEVVVMLARPVLGAFQIYIAQQHPLLPPYVCERPLAVWNLVSGVVALVELVALMTVLLLTQRRKGGSGPPFTATQSIFNALGFIWCVIGTIWVHDGVWYDKEGELIGEWKVKEPKL